MFSDLVQGFIYFLTVNLKRREFTGAPPDLVCWFVIWLREGYLIDSLLPPLSFSVTPSWSRVLHMLVR